MMQSLLAKAPSGLLLPATSNWCGIFLRRWGVLISLILLMLAIASSIVAAPAVESAAASQPAYRMFIDPLPIYRYWYWLLLPLCVLFSIVYKAVKCESMSDVPKQAISITFWIILGMASAAAGLALVVKVLE